jgi:lysozyme
MTFAQLKQYLLNNMIHGEQRGRGKPAQSVSYSLITPNYSRVWGPDISGWDKNVDLSVTRSRGASFVFIKAIDGTIQNTYFVPNRERAFAAGLFHAPYGWLYRNANVTCVSQARAYSNIVSQYPSDLPPVIDFEWTSWAGQPSNPNFDDLDRWVTEWLRLGNRKPILYTAAGYMNAFGTIPATLKAKFEGIFIANYGVNNPLMPYGYGASDWIFHQFTSSGDAPYLAPNDAGKLELDLNYFNGDIQSLRALAGGTTPPPAEPPTGGSIVTTYNLTATGNPTKRFGNADGTNDIGPNIQLNTKLTSTARNGITYNIGGSYVKYTQVRLDSTVDTPTDPPPVDPPPPVPTVSPVTFASMDFDLAAKTMRITRRRQDGTSEVTNDPIA